VEWLGAEDLKHEVRGWSAGGREARDRVAVQRDLSQNKKNPIFSGCFFRFSEKHVDGAQHMQ